jgi:hypothetical protein
MRIRVEEIIEQDQFETQHGTLLGWKFRAIDENANEVFCGINTKPNNSLKPGDEFDFEPSGKVVGVYTLGKRAQNQQGRGQRSFPSNNGQNRPATAQGAPQSHAAAPQAPRVVPTVTEAGAALAGLLGRSLKLVTSVAPEASIDARLDSARAIAISLKIALDRGDIRPDPTAADLAAEAAAQAAAVKAEEERLERELEAAREKLRAAQPKPAPPGYEASVPADDGADDPLPF